MAAAASVRAARAGAGVSGTAETRSSSIHEKSIAPARPARVVMRRRAKAGVLAHSQTRQLERATTAGAPKLEQRACSARPRWWFRAAVL
jgi:hypothetical protein